MCGKFCQNRSSPLPSVRNLTVSNFSKNSNLGDLDYSLNDFPSLTNLKLFNISVTPKLIKKVITNLDLSKVSGPDFCIPVVVLRNSEPEFLYVLVELFNVCLKESFVSDCWKVSPVVRPCIQKCWGNVNG